jgi:hypothetical protein
VNELEQAGGCLADGFVIASIDRGTEPVVPIDGVRERRPAQ